MLNLSFHAELLPEIVKMQDDAQECSQCHGLVLFLFFSNNSWADAYPTLIHPQFSSLILPDQ